jgi:hypothetical protein
MVNGQYKKYAKTNNATKTLNLRATNNNTPDLKLKTV